MGSDPRPLDLLAPVLEALRRVDAMDRIPPLVTLRQTIRDADARLAAAIRQAILELRDDRWTWAAIGDALGVSPQRAEQLSHEPNPQPQGDTDGQINPARVKS